MYISPRERHLVCACGAVLRIVFHLYSLSLTFGIVGDNDFHGIHHSHHSCSNPVGGHHAPHAQARICC